MLFIRNMRVHPINISLYQQNYTRECDTKTNNLIIKNASTHLMEYLSATSNYNLAFAGAVEPYYSIDTDGNVKRHTDFNPTAKEFSTYTTAIKNCLKGTQKYTNNVTFVRAEEIETTNGNGEVVINKEKVEELRKELALALEDKPQVRPFYAIDSDGNYTRFERKKDAHKHLDITSFDLNKALDRKYDAESGYVLLYADEFEEIDENGNIRHKTELAKEIFQKIKENPKPTLNEYAPIYAVNTSGEATKYPTIRTAMMKLSMKKNDIRKCLTGQISGIKGYSFITAEEIEQTKDGQTVVNEQRVQELQQSALRSEHKLIIAVDNNGKRKRFQNIIIASEELGIKKEDIEKNLHGELDTVSGYSFSSPKEPIRIAKKTKVEKKIEQQPERIQEDVKTQPKSNTTTPNKTGKNKKQKYDFKIYAINRDAEIREFDTVIEAANSLGVNADDIIYFLKHGKTQDKKEKLEGFVFATDDDK